MQKGRKRFRIMGLVGTVFTAAAVGCAPAASTPGSGSAPEPTGDRVSIGYGTQDREDMTASVSSLSSEEIEGMRFSTMAELLRGRVPGLQVIGAGNNVSLRIRGVSSITGSNEPLVVIDGMPVQRTAVGSALNWINPRDVERIDVLKDSAASIYGSRGGNGVIVITTKRPG